MTTRRNFLGALLGIIHAIPLFRLFAPKPTQHWRDVPPLACELPPPDGYGIGPFPNTPVIEYMLPRMTPEQEREFEQLFMRCPDIIDVSGKRYVRYVIGDK